MKQRADTVATAAPQTAETTGLPNKGGRPTKQCPELEDVILRGIIAGLRPAVAAQVAGIDRTTLERWRKADANFAQQIESAEASSEMENLQRINRAAARNWKAAAWILERRFPEHWGTKLQIGGTGDPIKIHVVRDAPESQAGANADHTEGGAGGFGSALREMLEGTDSAGDNITPLMAKETA